MIVNDNGDVVLKVLRNDLDAHPLGSSPDWQPVPGMVEFIDDHLGIKPRRQSPPRSSFARAHAGTRQNP